MLHGHWGKAPGRAPCPSNLSAHANASTAIHIDWSADRDIAADACAIKEPSARGSCWMRLHCVRRAHARIPCSPMRILDRYVCREVVSNSLLGLVVFTFVFFVPQLVRLMSLVVQHAATFKETATLLLSSLTPVLIFTLPMSMLVGVLIGLGRLSADSEIVALNASGISLRRLLVPIGAIALTATILAFTITLWLGPRSLRTLRSLETRLRTSQASFAVQPRVFDERFPHFILYVQDVGASGTRWRGVFLADSDSSAGSKVTLAKDAIVAADPQQDKLTLHFDDLSTHEFNPKDPQ